VSLVAILDADKEGFLRSTRSLIQTCGRAARNVNGKVFMYADVVTESMKKAVEETTRRRKIQEKYNRLHHITPTTIEKKILSTFMPEHYPQPQVQGEQIEEFMPAFTSGDDLDKLVISLEKEMREASKSLEFEKAAVIRDQLKGLKQLILFDFATSS
jgi:excinuclease ABC subunit B